MADFDEDDIYNTVPVNPPLAPIPEKEPKPSEAEPPLDGRLVDARVTGLDWWVTDETIMNELAEIGTVVRLDLLQDLVNGKFTGNFECSIIPKEGVIVFDALKQLNFEGSSIGCAILPRSMRPQQKGAAPAKPLKPAPMLYDDPNNPIPKEILALPKSKQKKPDDYKKSRKDDRDRDTKRRDDHDRDRRHGRKDDYDYDSDYGYSDDYDYRRKDDRDDRRSKKKKDSDKRRR
jgi:hypothetical protein